MPNESPSSFTGPPMAKEYVSMDELNNTLLEPYDFTGFDNFWPNDVASAESNHGTHAESGRAEAISRNDELFRELKAARDQLSQMQAKIDRLMQMMENLDMWSGALNPVVSMLLENMGNPNALESKNVENWLNVSESSEPSDWTNC